MIEIRTVKTTEDLVAVKDLFVEYANSLNFSLCFQNFDQELCDLPGKYSNPEGRLVLALNNGKAVGCVGLRKLQDTDCEIKRLYVGANYRGSGIGRQLVEFVLLEARKLGYRHVFLDTVSSMTEAIRLYQSIGFKQTSSYCHNPLQNVVYMELGIY